MNLFDKSSWLVVSSSKLSCIEVSEAFRCSLLWSVVRILNVKSPVVVVSATFNCHLWEFSIWGLRIKGLRLG